MAQSSTRREHRATRRALRAALRRRCASTRLTASCRRRPRSLATVAIAAGVDKGAATGVAGALRSVAKRLAVTPAEQATTRRTVAGRARKTRTVSRFTLAQVGTLLGSYKPRKPEYVHAVALIAAFATAA